MKSFIENVIQVSCCVGSDLALLLHKDGGMMGLVQCTTNADGTRDYSHVNAIRYGYLAAVMLGALVHTIDRVAAGKDTGATLPVTLAEARQLLNRINNEIPSVPQPASPEPGYPSPELAEDYSV